MGNFKWGARPEYRRCTAPPGRNETAVCRRSERCVGCPFPATGFICWGNDDDCMKTRIEKFTQEKQNWKRRFCGHIPPSTHCLWEKLPRHRGWVSRPCPTAWGSRLRYKIWWGIQPHRNGGLSMRIHCSALSNGAAPQSHLGVYVPIRPGEQGEHLLAVHPYHCQGSEAVRIHHPQGTERSAESRVGSYGTEVPGKRRQQQLAVPSGVIPVGENGRYLAVDVCESEPYNGTMKDRSE